MNEFCIHIGWKGEKADKHEHGKKDEHEKKGGDKKFKKWGHKKG